MIRPLSSVRSLFSKIAVVALTPLVFLWIFASHFIPSLLRVWNPIPLKVLGVHLSETGEVISEGHPCVLAYKLHPPAMDQGAPLCEYEHYLAQTASPYWITVNRPELLRKPKPAHLRCVARAFESHGLQAKEVHIAITNSTSVRTVVHPIKAA
jgi:hypothetical protein